jgi:hypothetical protein
MYMFASGLALPQKLMLALTSTDGWLRHPRALALRLLRRLSMTWAPHSVHQSRFGLEDPLGSGTSQLSP